MHLGTRQNITKSAVLREKENSSQPLAAQSQCWVGWAGRASLERTVRESPQGRCAEQGPAEPSSPGTPVSQAGMEQSTDTWHSGLPASSWDSGWENWGWHLSSGTRVPVTSRSHTRRPNVKFWLGKSPHTTHSSGGDLYPKYKGQTELCPAQGREFPLLGLKESWVPGTAVCRKGTEQATNHVSYTNRDLPAEISDSGEESGILGAQKGPCRAQSASWPLHCFTDQFLTLNRHMKMGLDLRCFFVRSYSAVQGSILLSPPWSHRGCFLALHYVTLFYSKKGWK